MKYISKNLLDALYYAEQNPKKSHTEIGKIFGVARHSIARWLKLDFKKFDLQGKNEYKNNFYYFTSEEKLALQDYDNYLTLSYPNFCKIHASAPKDKTTFVRWLRINGIDPQIKEKKSYHYNKSAFANIQTEEEAYWLGFILADGCIIQDNRLAINLASVDRHHLEKFCNFLQFPENEIQEIIKSSVGGAYTKDNPISTLNICSIEIVNNLKNKNIFARKSGKEIPYQCETPDLERAYIRGILDGDGYIRSTQYGFGVVGSKEVCEYIQNYINNYITDISKNHIREHGTIYKLEINGANQVSKILTHFYKNANIYLDRKYDLFRKQYCRV